MEEQKFAELICMFFVQRSNAMHSSAISIYRIYKIHGFFFSLIILGQ